MYLWKLSLKFLSETFSYVQSDGQTRYEKGILTNVNGADVYEVTGSYGFKGTDGKYYFVKYSSGVSGFRATVKGTNLKLSESSQADSLIYFAAFGNVSSLIDDRFSIDSLQIDEKLLMTLIG